MLHSVGFSYICSINCNNLMNRIELEISALSQSVAHNQSFAVVLAETQGNRRLPVVIGMFEAQAIAMELEKVKPSRPLTHDLMKSIFEEVEISLKEIVINNLMEGVFFAKLLCESNGKTYEIDSRTSDALALAVRFNCPIYTYEFVMQEAGIILEESFEKTVEVGTEESGTSKQEDKKETITSYSLNELNTLLEKAVEDEDYEQAAKLRDEIDKRR